MDNAQKIASERSGIQEPRIVLGRVNPPEHTQQQQPEENEEEPVKKKKKRNANNSGMRLRKR